jgi:predicted transposase YbfD/YdcC
MAAPLLDSIDITGKTVTGDALLTQRKFAEYLVQQRNANYLFAVKGNQRGVLEDVRLYFHKPGKPDFVHLQPPDHGRIETRSIWTTTELNGYLDFPHVRQAFAIHRERVDKKTGKVTSETAYGVTSLTPAQADPEQVLSINRGHWCIENKCHYILDWNYDEDRGRIRTGYAPENVSRLRRFAIGLIKSKGVRNVAQKMRQLNRNPRMVLDYLRMTKNSCLLSRDS